VPEIMKKASSKEIVGMKKKGFVLVDKIPAKTDPLPKIMKEILAQSLASNEKLLSRLLAESRKQNESIAATIIAAIDKISL
jgi:hypothetical protein